jgi:hypothetical protein
MASNKKSLQFEAKNVKAFTSWLKRFTSIDNSLLLEIDEKTSRFIGKVYNEERSVVKMSQIKYDEAGLITKISKDPKRIKVGIFNVPRLMKILDQFNDTDFTFTVDYQEIISDDASNAQYASEELTFKNKSLKMIVRCASLNIFKYISDELFLESIAKIDAIGKFMLSKTNIEKINSLASLDNEDKYIEFKFLNNNIYVAGKTFEYLLEEKDKLKDVTVTIFKEQYSNIDIENYAVELGEDRLVFNSVDSNTICVVSMISEKD